MKVVWIITIVVALTLLGFMFYVLGEPYRMFGGR
jgi:hypothetical protein